LKPCKVGKKEKEVIGERKGRKERNEGCIDINIVVGLEYLLEAFKGGKFEKGRKEEGGRGGGGDCKCRTLCS